jgi:hypothetical protein
VVGEGDPGSPMVGRTPAEAVDPARPVEERIFRVNVKVYETVQ